MGDLGKVYVKLDKVEGASDLVKINIVISEATFRLQITHVKEQKFWPYQIRNLTDKTINFFQKVHRMIMESDNKDAARWDREAERDPGTSTGSNTYRLTPRSQMCYAWDYPAAYNKTLVLEIDGRQRAIQLEEIGILPPMKLSESRSIGFDIWAADDATTQHLDIKYYVETNESLYRSRTPASQANKAKTSVRILLKEGLGISFINSARCMELAYLNLQDIRLNVRETETEYTSTLEVGWIQIDNQLFGGFYPIILYPTIVPKSEKDLVDHPVFNLSGVLLKDTEHRVIRFEYLQCLLQEMTAEVDEDFLWAVLETVKSVVASFKIADSYDYKISDPPIRDSEDVIEASGGNLYFELFLLHPIQLDISFVRLEAINSEPTLLQEYCRPGKPANSRWCLSTSNPLGILTNMATVVGLNINEAPITFNAVVLEDLHSSVEGLLNQLAAKYRGEALRQLHKVLGSADFIGNPVGLWNNITSGVQDQTR